MENCSTHTEQVIRLCHFFFSPVSKGGEQTCFSVPAAAGSGKQWRPSCFFRSPRTCGVQSSLVKAGNTLLSVLHARSVKVHWSATVQCMCASRRGGQWEIPTDLCEDKNSVLQLTHTGRNTNSVLLHTQVFASHLPPAVFSLETPKQEVILNWCTSQGWALFSLI